VAHALDELVAFATEEGDGRWKSFGRLGGCDSVEVLATDHGGGKNMVRRSRGSGCESRGRQVCGGAKCMRTHVASEHKRLTKRHFAVGAADVWHACELAFAFVAVKGEGGGDAFENEKGEEGRGKDLPVHDAVAAADGGEDAGALARGSREEGGSQHTGGGFACCL
jgi:hypothetical protein